NETEEIMCKIDVKPTILNSLGISNKDDNHFGNDMFSEDSKGYIALRNGDFISNDYISTSGVCNNRETGEPVETEETGQENTDNAAENQASDPCAPIKQKVEKELQLSDNIIYGDLFRFVDFSETTDTTTNE